MSSLYPTPEPDSYGVSPVTHFLCVLADVFLSALSVLGVRVRVRVCACARVRPLSAFRMVSLAELCILRVSCVALLCLPPQSRRISKHGGAVTDLVP